MLDSVELDKTMEKNRYKAKVDELEPKLAHLQREFRRRQIPVIIVFEGWGASGKGTLINRLILPLDPRGFQVHTIKNATEEEQMRPFLWRFWTKTPANGQIAIFDRSWYRRVINERLDGLGNARLDQAYSEISAFEKTLTDNGAVLIKLFLHISEKEQKKRFERLQEAEETAWRVTKADWENHRRYRDFFAANNEMLERTNAPYAPWTVVEANDKRFATIKVLSSVIERLEKQLSATDKPTAAAAVSFPSVLAGLDLSKTISKDTYQAKLEEYQKHFAALHNQIYRNRIPCILVFEGPDASGKGGAIRRLTRNLDPRSYRVVPTPAPTPEEKAHHYLWRFWNTFPKAGHITIYDRSWYGRVLVERVEGFCDPAAWQRAYQEINDMESCLVNSGAVLLKFWLQIDKDEQARRFESRMRNPDKQWKLTEEDWRNRSKWDAYATCADEMLFRTSTPYAPWTVVEANQKQYARLKVLKTVINALEQKLKFL